MSGEEVYLCYPCPWEGIVRMSVAEVLTEYWDYWCERMRQSNASEEHINYGECIADWMVIHWAWREDEYV